MDINVFAMITISEELIQISEELVKVLAGSW